MQSILIQLGDYFWGAWRFRWLMLGLVWLLSIVGWVYVSGMPENYQATARIYVDTNSILRPLLKGLTVQPNLKQRTALVSRTLLSRPNLEKLIRMTDLDLQVRVEVGWEQPTAVRQPAWPAVPLCCPLAALSLDFCHVQVASGRMRSVGGDTALMGLSAALALVGTVAGHGAVVRPAPRNAIDKDLAPVRAACVRAAACHYLSGHLPLTCRQCPLPANAAVEWSGAVHLGGQVPERLRSCEAANLGPEPSEEQGLDVRARKRRAVAGVVGVLGRGVSIYVSMSVSVCVSVCVCRRCGRCARY